MSLVANARMYSVTPAVEAAWRALFAWLARTSGVPLAYLDHAAPAPLEALWTRDDLGAAFMCGFPFASAASKPWVLAAPVPAPARYEGQPRYCTDFIVRADSRFVRLDETFGGRIGWTVEHSQSGYNAVRQHLERVQEKWEPVFRPDARQIEERVQEKWEPVFRPDARQIEKRVLQAKPLYAQSVGPLITPRRVIDAVLEDRIDVGPLDSYVHDLLKRHDPQAASRLRVVASTAMTPIPPLVASRAVDREVASRLRQALLSAHMEGEMAAIRDALLIARFAPIDPADYQILLS